VKNLSFICSLATIIGAGFLGCDAANNKANTPITSNSEIANKSEISSATIKIDEPATTTASAASPSKEATAGEATAGEATVGDSKTEPTHITVQHCLIGFKGSVPGKPIRRTKEEAKELATKLLEELKAGADFDEIIRKNTDDSPPGIYKMSNFGISPDARNEVFARGEMVPAFGNTGFPLQVGEYGLAEFDPKKSKYGWHIVKRVE
jgi:hypothetical protein